MTTDSAIISSCAPRNGPTRSRYVEAKQQSKQAERRPFHRPQTAHLAIGASARRRVLATE